MSLVKGREAGAGGHEFVLQKTLVNIWRRFLLSQFGGRGRGRGAAEQLEHRAAPGYRPSCSKGQRC